jgi:hypothetical protein
MPSISKKTSELIMYHRFKEGYLRKTGINLTDETQQESPDFIAINQKTGKILGIEISGVYQNPEEAKLQYWRQEGWNGFFKGDQLKIIDEFNRVISEKAQKSFSYNIQGNLLLAIYLGSIVFNEAIDMKFMNPHIIIPENNFDEIWVIIRAGQSRYDLYQLQ